MFNRPNSLALRVTVFVGVTIFACLSAISLIVQSSIKQHFKEQDADELNEVFLAVKEKLSQANQQQIAPSSILLQAVSGHHGVYYLVRDANNQVIFSSQGANLERYPGKITTQQVVNPAALIEFDDGRHILRATELTLNLDGQQGSATYKVVVASNMEFHINYMQTFQRSFWGILLLVGIITVMVARFAVYRGHAPLRHLSRKIESITADKLDVRINANQTPVELKALVNSFNAMIERLEDGFERLSHFSTDIAHELRTPITNLTTQTQVILSQPRDLKTYTETLYSNLEEYERMSKMVSDMLLLAQAEHGLIKPLSEPLNCHHQIMQVVDYFSLLAEEKNISIEIQGPDITVMCDKSMFRQSLNNLLSNAIRYSPQNATIHIKTENTATQLKLCVSNTGSQIPTKKLARLFDRFYRGDPSRNRDGHGAGLGLTIARSVMRVNHADIEAKSDQHTTEFCMVFNR